MSIDLVETTGKNKYRRVETSKTGRRAQHFIFGTPK